jgi:hypothetical protein
MQEFSDWSKNTQGNKYITVIMQLVTSLSQALVSDVNASKALVNYGSSLHTMASLVKDCLASGVPKKELHLGYKCLPGGLLIEVIRRLAQAVANPCDLVKVRMIHVGDGMAVGGGAPRTLHGISGSL